MKTKICIFSSLLCLCNFAPVMASDCIGEGCEIEVANVQEFVTVDTADAESVMELANQKPKAIILAVPDTEEEIEEVTWMDSDPDVRKMPRAKKFQIPMQIKEQVSAAKDFMESQSDGSYKPDIYMRNVKLGEYTADVLPLGAYQQNMIDIAMTLSKTDELLRNATPSENLTVLNIVSVQPEDKMADNTKVLELEYDGCPFETIEECKIWRKKPTFSESVAPRTKKIRKESLYKFLDTAKCNINITGNHKYAKPLVDRYHALMRASQKCCTEGLIYSMKQNGESDDMVYKFLFDDANFYGFGERCVMMSDAALDTEYPEMISPEMLTFVRDECLCKNREWFIGMLSPFEQAYKAMPEFRYADFSYVYTDGLGRKFSVSINAEVQDILKRLKNCP